MKKTLFTLTLACSLPLAQAALVVDWIAETEPLGTNFVGGWNAATGPQHAGFGNSGSPNDAEVVLINNINMEAFVNSTKTVEFDGNDRVNINSWSGQYNGADKGYGKFEIWFRPDDFTDRDVIFETGGTADGLGIVLDGSVLKFGASSGNGGANAWGHTSVDLQQFIDNNGFTLGTDYLHLEALVKPSSDRFELSVNDRQFNFYSSVSEIDGGTTPLIDWDGGDSGGLGSVGDTGGLGGNRSNNFGAANGAWTPFEGAVARFQFSVKNVPEPSSVALLGIGAFAIRGLRRRRQVEGDRREITSDEEVSSIYR